MSMWDGRELERRTAARAATAGFAPAINVTHSRTQSEFDIYAFLPTPQSLERLMVQCSVPRPTHDRLSALKGNADTFRANHMLYVTEGNPHPTQVALAGEHGVELVGEHTDAVGVATFAGATIDVQSSLSLREKTILTHLRALAWLRRVALDASGHSEAADKLLEVCKQLDEVSLVSDPFDRLTELYKIHYYAPKLAEECALAEGLATSGRRALKNAYASNCGTYTQSALAAQTLNRTHTLIAFCECACLVALGEQVPDALDAAAGRRGGLIRWLSEQPSRHKLAIVAFELVYGWGGLWCFDGVSCAPAIACAVDIDEADLHGMRECVDRLLRAEGMDKFIKPVSYKGHSWEALALLPFYAKGIGVERLEQEEQCCFKSPMRDRWVAAAIDLQSRCNAYEKSH